MKQQWKNAGYQMMATTQPLKKKMPVVDTDGRFKTKNKKHDAKITKKRNGVFFENSKLFIECG